METTWRPIETIPYKRTVRALTVSKTEIVGRSTGGVSTRGPMPSNMVKGATGCAMFCSHWRLL